MKKILTLLYFSLFVTLAGNAQIFWAENFEGGSTTGLVASSYTGPNGAWTITATGAEGSFPNQWYVSCEENGYTSGNCGTGCVAASSTATLSTLHVGVDFISVFDGGATYLASSSTATDRRANSPTINCTGRYGITLTFNYIENGEGTDDDASVWYSPDNGTTWSLLVNTPKTAPICPGGQGLWTAYSIALPASADNNATVKIGFRWVNDNDAVGTDPSFAVDSVALRTTSSSVTPTPSYTVTPGFTVCAGGCLLFDNTTTGSIDSLRWSGTGASIVNPTGDTTTMCFAAAGPSSVTLTVYKSGTPYTFSRIVTVNSTPAAISGSHTVCATLSVPLVCATPGGTWSSAMPTIAAVGSTSGMLIGVSAGTTTITYMLSSGCYTTWAVTVHPMPCTTGLLSASGLDMDVELLPNPATDELLINISEGAFSRFEIFNEIGQTVKKEMINDLRLQVDIRLLPAGVYYVRFFSDYGIEVRRFVKSE